MTKLRLLVLSLIVFGGCSSIVLKPADYAWPLESVLKADTDGVVTDGRHTFTVNLREMFFAEYGSYVEMANTEVRIIRDYLGYYYIAATGFKNIYLFYEVEGGMKLETIIEIPESGTLTKPAFNQRSPYIELLNGNNKYLLSKDGIAR